MNNTRTVWVLGGLMVGALAIAQLQPARTQPRINNANLAAGDFHLIRSGTETFKFDSASGSAWSLYSGASVPVWKLLGGAVADKGGKGRYEFLAWDKNQLIRIDTQTGKTWSTHSVDSTTWDWDSNK